VPAGDVQPAVQLAAGVADAQAQAPSAQVAQRVHIGRRVGVAEAQHPALSGQRGHTGV
jgi:hypothetical protein